ncbi:uncharacterized protein LOC120703209 isoform X2 [Panicum virgatum]|uniref:Uncharacterized protein n=1 Tax=Panicum virgatum TaxID=38727 RepID=A0A8T0TMK2_PANVG|nr:uncharacterized protein LOC120703209 isoform X2 [Panicum virgatum]KAG2610908.1 hypothetical protein PVAP13_4KG226305 [Panicum virgatum]
MPMTSASQEELPQEAGAANDEMREREGVDAEVRQLPDQVLRDKAQCIQDMFDRGTAGRLPDRGQKLRLLLDAMHRELNRRQPPRGGARAPGGDGCERIVLSNCAESSDQVLRVKARRMQDIFDKGLANRLPDRGKKLLLAHDALRRELNRRRALRGGARAPGGDGCERIVLSNYAKSSDEEPFENFQDQDFEDFEQQQVTEEEQDQFEEYPEDIQDL